MVLGKQRHDMAALRRPPEVGEANLIVGRADVGSRVPEGQAGVPTGQGPDLTRAGRAGQRPGAVEEEEQRRVDGCLGSQLRDVVVSHFLPSRPQPGVG